MSEELTWAPAWRIRDLIANREVSAVEVTDHFLGRIEEVGSSRVDLQACKLEYSIVSPK